MFRALLNTLFYELKMFLLLSLKFSIDKEELRSHVIHTLCILYDQRKAI